MEHIQVPHSSPSPNRNRISRQTVIIFVGLLAILASVGVRNSKWALERSLKQLSLEELALAIHDHPKDSMVFIYYADALMSAGRIEESATAFAHAAQLESTNERAFLGLGSAQLKLGKADDAQTSFERAIKLSPKDKEAYLGLAQAEYRLGYAAKATEPLKKMIDLDPNNGQAWYFLGKLYGDAHESDQALDALQHAVKLDPGKAAFWRDLAQVERHYSRYDSAEKHLLKAQELNPKDSLISLWLGQLYLQMGDTPDTRAKAEKSFEAGVTIDPQLQEAYAGLGALQQRSGNYRAAISNFRMACSIDQSDNVSLRNLGDCLIRVGDTAEGKKLLAAAVELESAKREIDDLTKRTAADPKSRDLRLRLARVYRKYENYPSALRAYSAYQNLGAEDLAVRKEMEAYESELVKKGILPARNTTPSSTAPQR